jgi:hypothetical protein
VPLTRENYIGYAHCKYPPDEEWTPEHHTANEIEVLSITVPAEAELVKCDRPSGLK